MSHRTRIKTAFTLLELLAVITILGIIAAVVMSRISLQAYDAKKKCCSRYKRDLDAAIEEYFFSIGAYPAAPSDLNPTYYPDVLPICPITNAPYTIDGATHRIQGHNH